MEEPIPQLRIALALVVGVAIVSYGLYGLLTPATLGATSPLVVTAAGAVILGGGVVRWGYRRRNL